MGLDQFPMFRLATLLARQLSSPIASRIKAHAAEHPWFRRALIVRAGRLYRGAELAFKLWMLRLGRPPRSPPLSEAEATQVGADIIGEVIIFSLGAAIVVFEVNRQAMNKEAKELEEQSRWVAVGVQLEELQREVALQQRDLDRLLAALRKLAPRAALPSAAPAAPPAAPSSAPPSIPPSAPQSVPPGAPPSAPPSEAPSSSVEPPASTLHPQAPQPNAAPSKKRRIC